MLKVSILLLNFPKIAGFRSKLCIFRRKLSEKEKQNARKSLPDLQRYSASWSQYSP